MYAVLIVIAVGVLWAWLSPLDQVVSGKGRVISVEQNIILQSQETAEIKDVRVTVGQPVKKGDILVVLDPTIPQADFQQAAGSYDGIIKALELSKSEVRTIEARLQSARETEQMTERLVEKNFQSRLSLINQRERRLELEQALINAQSRLNDLFSQKNALEQQLVKAKRRKDVIQIVAPRDGVVLEVSSLTKSSVARATEPLVTLVPIDIPVLAEVSIGPADISGISSGQEVKIKLDAFPFQRHGYLTGRVSAVSPDSIQKGGAVEPGSYVLRVQFDPPVDSDSMFYKLIPGMTLVAEVLTDKRTVLEYLFDPLLRVKMESLNEKVR
jgi:HlyD family secretion protein